VLSPSRYPAALELPGFCLYSSLPTLDSHEGHGGLDGDAVGVANTLECAARCVGALDCVSWTHEKGMCTLRGSFKSPCKQFEPWLRCIAAKTSTNGCHSGVVRPLPQSPTTDVDAALLRALNGNASSAVKLASGADDANDFLASTHLATFGQCNEHVCLDVDHCAARFTGPGRFAFVLTHDLRQPSTNRFSASHTYVLTISSSRCLLCCMLALSDCYVLTISAASRSTTAGLLLVVRIDRALIPTSRSNTTQCMLLLVVRAGNSPGVTACRCTMETCSLPASVSLRTPPWPGTRS
jgi:hypothetical protein